MASTGTAAPSAEKRMGKMQRVWMQRNHLLRKRMHLYTKRRNWRQVQKMRSGRHRNASLAALRQAGIAECTKEEAEKAVRAFRGRKVE